MINPNDCTTSPATRQASPKQRPVMQGPVEHAPAEVKKVQEWARAGKDGMWGDDTTLAVRKKLEEYKKEKGLEVNGEYDTKTAEAMYADPKTKDVAEALNALKKRGLLDKIYRPTDKVADESTMCRRAPEAAKPPPERKTPAAHAVPAPDLNTGGANLFAQMPFGPDVPPATGKNSNTTELTAPAAAKPAPAAQQPHGPSVPAATGSPSNTTGPSAAAAAKLPAQKPHGGDSTIGGPTSPSNPSSRGIAPKPENYFTITNDRAPTAPGQSAAGDRSSSTNAPGAAAAKPAPPATHSSQLFADLLIKCGFQPPTTMTLLHDQAKYTGRNIQGPAIVGADNGQLMNLRADISCTKPASPTAFLNLSR